MAELPDPRSFAFAGAGHPLRDAAASVIAAPDLEWRTRRAALRLQLRARLLQGDAADLRDAFCAMPDARHYRILFEELAQVVDAAQDEAQSVRLRLFALPLVLIAASGQPQRLAGSLADAGVVRALFERSGVLGQMQNFGLSPALCTLEALESLGPVAIFNATRMTGAKSVEAFFQPADLTVDSSREQAHLRFLAGAGISRGDAPDFIETAANIGAWGGALSRLIEAQLRMPGVQLLVLPRPPLGLMRAPHAGRRAQLDVALHLFVSNAVRRFRMTVGEPVAILSSHDDGDVRLTLSSLLADEMVEGFRWPLARLDDLDAIERAMAQLLRDVRVDDVRVMPRVLPASRASGGVSHPRAAEWDALSGEAARH